jgi:uncharacterized membrane protein
MSDRVPLRKASGILLAVMMVATLFAGLASADNHAQLQVPGNNAITSEQASLIAARLGPGAPFGEWQKHRDTTTFYLHADTASPTAPDKLRFDTQLVAGRGDRNYVPLMGGQVGANTVTFLPSGCDTTLAGAPPWRAPQLTDDTTIYRISATFVAQGEQVSRGVFNVEAIDLDPACVDQGTFASFRLNYVQPSTGASAPNNPVLVSSGNDAVFTNSVEVVDNTQPALGAVYGKTLPAGHMIGYRVSVSYQGPPTPITSGGQSINVSPLRLVVDDGAQPSFISVTSDAVRMNMWTTDRLGEPTTTYPRAATSPMEDRRLNVHMVQYSTWGNNEQGSACPNIYAGTSPTFPRDAKGCPYDGIDSWAMRLRVRDTSTDRLVKLDLNRGLADGDQLLSDSFISCCNDESRTGALDTTRHLTYLSPSLAEQAAGLAFYRYSLQYSEKFPDGTYQIEFQESNRLWNYALRFHVGGAGFDFQWADGERVDPHDPRIASHTVALREPTKYSAIVTNRGRNSDTFGLAIPVPGSGWTGSVSPQVVTLAPGAYAQVDVMVLPPESARPGDVKVVALTATSIADNAVKTLFTNTTVTASIEYGVRVTSPTLSLETRPHFTKTFPIIVHNDGTVRNSYILTADGAPEGWTVNFSPSFLGAYAASREATTLAITAPAEAQPGLSFSLSINACPVEKSKGPCGTLQIPVKIFLVDRLRVDVLADDYDAGTNAHIIEMQHTLQDRLSGGTVVQRDNNFDHGTLFRLRFDNYGDFTDAIELTAAWDPDVARYAGGNPAATDNANCEARTGAGTRDGVPDGWRFWVLDDTEVGGAGAAQEPGPGRQFDPGMVAGTPPGDGVEPRFVRTAPGGALRGVDNPFPYGNNPQNQGQNARIAGADAFAGDYSIGTLTLPPGTVQDLYVELFWVTPTGGGCPAPLASTYQSPNGRAPSPKAQLRFSYRSLSDESQRGNFNLLALLNGQTNQVDPNGNPPPGAGTDFRVEVQPGPGQPEVGYAPKTGPYPFATYNMLAYNTGDAYDTLKISVDQGRDGWRHTIAAFPSGTTGTPQGTGIVYGSPTTDPPGSAGNAAYPGRNPPTCTPDSATATTQLICRGIGVYDAVNFQIRAAPPANAKVGDTDLMSVTVASSKGENAGLRVTDTLTVRSFVTGDYGFSIRTPDGLSVNAASPNSASGPGIELHGYLGQTIAVPFTIRNVGESHDRYHVTVEEGPAAWNPSLSQGPIIAVPNGMDFHGFLGITIPDNARQTARIDPETGTLLYGATENAPLAETLSEHFRIKVQAIDNPAHQTATLDVYVPVVAKPDVEMAAQAVSIASNSIDRIPLSAHSEPEAYTHITFDGYYLNALSRLPSLPDGYEFACLDPTLPTYVPSHFDAENQKACAPDPPVAGSTDRIKVGYSTNGEALQQLNMKVPAGQLAVSRVAHRIWGTSEAGGDKSFTWADAIVNLRSTYGVRLFEQDNLTTRIIPPGALVAGVPTILYNVTIENTGLTPQSVLLSNSDLPPGWQIFYDMNVVQVQPPGFQFLNGSQDCAYSQVCRYINPQSRVVVQVGVIAPAGARPDDEARILLFGTVQEDKTQVSQLLLKAVVGRYDPRATTVDTEGGPQVTHVAPQEQARFTVTLTNNGTVPDLLNVTAILPASIKDAMPYSWESGCDSVALDSLDTSLKSCLAALKPGQSRTVTLVVSVPHEVQPTKDTDPGYEVSLSVQSMLAPRPTSSIGTAVLKILGWSAADIDGDGVEEYAIDRDQDMSNGFEQFRENLDDAGRTTRPAALEQMLSDAARAAKTVNDRLVYPIHSGCDAPGHEDHFLDTDADGLPNVFWMPGKHVAQLTFSRDVNADGNVEYFIDCEGDERFDEAFDTSAGEFLRLLQRFIDTGSFVDYVVDANRNGQPDVDETVLFGGPGGLVSKIQFNVDMNGDGKIDAVIDEDGDGKPDFFIPAGEASSIAIVLEDVTGDKVLDWTYDASGKNGAPNAYYDPMTHKSGLIDTKAEFVRDLFSHWYIFAMFLVAMVLFGVLVMVTRRR